MNTNKYLDTLKEYKLEVDSFKVAETVQDIIDLEFKSNNNKEVYKTIYSCIDLTTLKSTDTKESIWKFIEDVNDFDGSTDMENVAAICIYPNFVEVAEEALTAENVKIACVTGGFPSSQTFPEIKVAETALAVANGANEIDIVLNLGLFLDEAYEELCEEIDEIKESCREAKLKVILETGAIKSLTKIKIASILSMYSGADFIKTSTGKTYEGATLEAAYVMCSSIKEYYEKTGRKIGFKASGGISDTKTAVEYYTIVKSVLGEEWCNKDLFRIGASTLTKNLLKDIQK